MHVKFFHARELQVMYMYVNIFSNTWGNSFVMHALISASKMQSTHDKNYCQMIVEMYLAAIRFSPLGLAHHPCKWAFCDASSHSYVFQFNNIYVFDFTSLNKFIFFVFLQSI